ncbi:hypothetical protein PM082_022015 [Marasmius tenuissimus]|nr:hypothetical protein PM082_022015 [Marasmius tenuissimus]
MPGGSDIDLLTVMVGSTLYGAYTILYVLSVYILFTQKRGRYWVHWILITTIFVAATIQFGLRYRLYDDYMLDIEPRTEQIHLAISVLTIIANCVADILLVGI